jgi:nucleoid-associated protein EbfC
MMGSGFSKMKKQARMMEEQYGKMREELKSKEFIGSSGNGLVTVTLSGDYEIKALRIKPECVDPSDTEALEDLVRAAFSEALKQLSENSSENSLGGFPLPMSL